MTSKKLLSTGGRLLGLLMALSLVYPAQSYAQDTRQAAENRISFSAGVGRSDNVLRDATDEIESDLYLIGIDADFEYLRPKFDFTLDADLDYIDYSESAVRDRPDGNLDARLTVKLIDERLNWYVADRFSQIRSEADLGDRPDNLREYNVLSSGFDGRVPVGGRSSLKFSAAVSERNGRSSDNLDSSEVAAGISLERRLSPTRTAALVVDTSMLEYDVADDYDIQRAYLLYESELASGAVLFAVGANRVSSPQSGFETGTKPMVRLSWSRDVAARSSVTVSGSHEINDLGSSAIEPLGDTGRTATTGQLTATSSPYAESRASIGWTLQYDRSVLQISVNGTNQQFTDPGVDDFVLIGLNGSWRYDLGNRSQLLFRAYHGNRETNGSGAVSRDTSADLGLRYDFGRRTSIELSYGHRRRTDDVAEDYSENQFRIDFVFNAI